MKINVFSLIKPFMVKHQPEILMAVGIGGMIFSTIWAVKATKQADKRINEELVKRGDNDISKVTISIKEKFKLTWKYYIPVVISAGLSIPCIVAGNRVSNRRNAALVAAYTISETALQTYQEKTKELVGEKKANDIRDAVAQDTVNNSKFSKDNRIFLTGDGDSLFFEPLSGRYFKSNWNKIQKTANELNAKAIGGIYGNITLTEWLEELGLNKTETSDMLGWTIMDGSSGIIDIVPTSVLREEDNTPCGSIMYNVRPRALY